MTIEPQMIPDLSKPLMTEGQILSLDRRDQQELRIAIRNILDRYSQNLDDYVKALDQLASEYFGKQQLYESLFTFLLCVDHQSQLVEKAPEDKLQKADLAVYLSKGARVAAMRNELADYMVLYEQALLLVVELDQDVDFANYPFAVKLRVALTLTNAGWAMLLLGEASIAYMLAIGALGTLMEIDVCGGEPQLGLHRPPEADLLLLLSLASDAGGSDQRAEGAFQELLTLVHASPVCSQKLLIVVLRQYYDFLRNQGRSEDAAGVKSRLLALEEEWAVKYA